MAQHRAHREITTKTLLISAVASVVVTALVTLSIISLTRADTPTTPTNTTQTAASDSDQVTITSTSTLPPPPSAIDRTTSTPPTPGNTSGAQIGAAAQAQSISNAQIHGGVAGTFGVIDKTWSDLLASWATPAVWKTPQRYNGDGFFDSTTGDNGPICGDSPVGAGTASYCPSNFAPDGTGFLSWDTEFFRNIRQYGKAAIYMVIAHEMGHVAQTRFLPAADIEAFSSGTTPEYELQADCLSGATLARAVMTGLVTFTPEDLQDMSDANLHPATNTDLSHGTPQQRDEQFQRGYASADMETCFDTP